MRPAGRSKCTSEIGICLWGVSVIRVWGVSVIDKGEGVGYTVSRRRCHMGKAKLGPEVARYIREKLGRDRGLTYAEVGRALGVSRQTIELIARGKSYPDAGGPIVVGPRRHIGAKSVEANRRREERAERRARAVEIYRSGKTLIETAGEVGVAYATVARWVTAAGGTRGRGKGNVTQRQREWGRTLGRAMGEMRRARSGRCD